MDARWDNLFRSQLILCKDTTTDASRQAAWEAERDEQAERIMTVIK